MCTMFWSLMAEVECPGCKQKERRELQTHWMGQLGSCMHRYELGEPVEEIYNIQNAEVPEGDHTLFITECPACQPGFFYCGGKILNGAVVAVWPVRMTS